jgi:hypothetical protein
LSTVAFREGANFVTVECQSKGAKHPAEEGDLHVVEYSSILRQLKGGESDPIACPEYGYSNNESHEDSPASNGDSNAGSLALACAGNAGEEEEERLLVDTGEDSIGLDSDAEDGGSSDGDEQDNEVMAEMFLVQKLGNSMLKFYSQKRFPRIHICFFFVVSV